MDACINYVFWYKTDLCDEKLILYNNQLTSTQSLDVDEKLKCQLKQFYYLRKVMMKEELFNR